MSGGASRLAVGVEYRDSLRGGSFRGGIETLDQEAGVIVVMRNRIDRRAVGRQHSDRVYPARLLFSPWQGLTSSLSRDQIVFSLIERTGNIRMADFPR